MSENKITVRIDSSRPIFIEADADSFGQIFAGISDEEQVNVLRSMVEHMKPHKIQWDYIAIALEKDENRQVRDDLSVIFPSQHELLSALAAKDAEIALLTAQNDWLGDRLSSLQLPSNSPKKVKEWLAECGMPTALKDKSDA